MSEVIVENVVENIITWQGENQDAGKRMFLIRFKHCSRIESNKSCLWCDTKVKLRISNSYSMKLSEIQDVINKEKVGLLLSGGEPTYSKNFDCTLLMLNNLEYRLANVESNGHRLLDLIPLVNPSKNVNYSYSPKIFTLDELGEEMERSLKLATYENVYFKVVFEDTSLIEQYLDFISSLTVDINHRVFLMPQGKNRDELLANMPKVLDTAEFYKFNISSRDHLIYSFI